MARSKKEDKSPEQKIKERFDFDLKELRSNHYPEPTIQYEIGEKEMNWKSVKDELPMLPEGNYTSVEVIVCYGGNRCTSMDYVRTRVRDKIVERFEWKGKLTQWNITHWTYLPEPPDLNHHQ